MEVQVRRTDDTNSARRLAASLPDYFNAAGLAHMDADLSRCELFGAFAGPELIGFAIFTELNPQAIELAWLAVRRDHWSHGVGTRLVTESLAHLPSHYQACQVKTLAPTSPYPPYERTRRFYHRLGFIPLEIIDPYPGWLPGNPCQLMVMCLTRESPAIT
jgi:GNAT superfamily N-acetyltransferase